MTPQEAGGPPASSREPDGAAIAAPSAAFRRPTAGRLADGAYSGLTALAALVGVVAIAYLVVKMAGLTGDTWDQIGVGGFLSGRDWVPAADQFGAFAAIYGTVVTSAIAMLLAVPLSIGCAIGTAVLLPRWMRGPIATLIDLLAAIPSVVFGLWGFLVLVPAVKPVLEWIARNSHGIGALEGPVLGGSIILAALVLAVMILPIMTAVIREVIASVPDDQREAALALGATRWEMIRSAILPMARSGIVGAAALGLGRAVGETIAVMMIIGGQPNVFQSLLGSGQTLAGTIASEYNSAVNSLHTSALVAMGLVLFIIAFFVNMTARMLVSRSGGGGRLRGRLTAPIVAVGHVVSHAVATPLHRRRPQLPGSPFAPAAPVRALPHRSLNRRIRSGLGEFFIAVAVLIALVPLALVIGYCVVRGAHGLSWDFFTADGEPDFEGNGIKHALVGTGIMVGVAVVVAVPLGVLTALFIRDATAKGPWMRRLSSALGTYVDMLLGVPSIVAGLVIAVAVVLPMGKFSAFAGGLSLAFIMYPIVVRSADEMLRLVPHSQVEAALALGAPRWRTTWSVSLPAALPGILTGVMIAIARVAGETAPLLVTALGAQFFSSNLFAPIASLPAYIFTGTINSTVPVAQGHAWAAALVLVTFVLILNLVARGIARRVRPESR